MHSNDAFAPVAYLKLNNVALEDKEMVNIISLLFIWCIFTCTLLYEASPGSNVHLHIIKRKEKEFK